MPPSDGLKDTKASQYGFVLTGTILLVVAVITGWAQLPPPVGPSEGGLAGAYRAVWPQGWNFFQKAPYRDVPVAYAVDDTGRISALVTRAAANAENLWGLRRGNYSQMVEIAALLSEIPEDRWIWCHDPYAVCHDLVPRTVPYPLLNPLRNPTLCGRIALVDESPMQWQYSQPSQLSGQAVRLVVVDLTCTT